MIKLTRLKVQETSLSVDILQLFLDKGSRANAKNIFNVVQKLDHFSVFCQNDRPMVMVVHLATSQEVRME